MSRHNTQSCPTLFFYVLKKSMAILLSIEDLIIGSFGILPVASQVYFSYKSTELSLEFPTVFDITLPIMSYV